MRKDIALRIKLERWEDGELLKDELEGLDRWAVHESHAVTVELGDIVVPVIQRPREIGGNKLGVGACLWDGALILAGHLMANVPRHHIVGAKIVELGAGVGFAGIICAKLGARVVLTERECMMELLQSNAEANGFNRAGQSTEGGDGSCECMELTWGDPGYEERAAMLGPADMVIAADCVYVDGEGESPSVPAFVQTARCMSGPSTRVIVCQEVRSSAVSAQLRDMLERNFKQVRRISPTSLPVALRQDYVELFECRCE